MAAHDMSVTRAHRHPLQHRLRRLRRHGRGAQALPRGRDRASAAPSTATCASSARCSPTRSDRADAGAVDLDARRPPRSWSRRCTPTGSASSAPLLRADGRRDRRLRPPPPVATCPTSCEPTNYITSDDGSLVTLMLRIIAERGIAVTPLEATVFALGIHEDTGSLTFPTTTVRDAEALAFCMRQGANQQLIERFLHNPLSGAAARPAARACSRRRGRSTAGGLDVLVAAVRGTEYVEGVSLVVHKAIDLTNCDAFVLLVEMEERVFVTARSRVGGARRGGRRSRPLGGGGHAAAASAHRQGRDARRRARARLRAVAAERPRRRRRPRQTLMSQPVHWVTTRDDASTRRSSSASATATAGSRWPTTSVLVGLGGAPRPRPRRRATSSGHAPVKAVMTTRRDGRARVDARSTS